jgi:hypothetical protein
MDEIDNHFCRGFATYSRLISRRWLAWRAKSMRARLIAYSKPLPEP